MDPVLEFALAFVCCLGFGSFLLWLNKLTGSSWGKITSWVLLWASIVVMMALLMAMLSEVGG